MKTYLLAVLFAASSAFACTEEVESTDVRTSGIYPVITVTADGSGRSKVEVLLKVGGSSSNTHLELRGQDQLTATANGETKQLDETSGNVYTASFEGDAEDTEFVIAFERGEADESAPSSRVRLPAPFDLSLGATEVSRTDGILDFEWDGAGSGNIAWNADGDCIFPEDDTTTDDGQAQIGAGILTPLSSQKDKSCSVELTLTRSRSGSGDPMFSEGADVKARQVRSQSFTSTP